MWTSSSSTGWPIVPEQTSNGCQVGYVRVNGEPVKSNHKVKPEDVVTVELPQPVYEFELLPEPMDLDVVHEDDHVLVINKPMNLVVHPGHGNYSGTLVNGVLHHFQSLPSLPGSPEPRPGLVHRLDKDTTGLMVLGKTERALTELSEQFFERTVNRRYWALVWGDLTEDGTVKGHVGRSLRDRRVQQVFVDGREGKHAVTHYRVLERLGPVTLVECKLETGRTHQIRVHMQHRTSLVWRPRVRGQRGGERAREASTTPSCATCLKPCPDKPCAKTLGFTHPGTGERMDFQSELPEDMQKVLAKWKTYIDAASV